MSDLLTELREHDLPPRWDGRVVIWKGWEYQGTALVCPSPQPTVCEGCGAPDMHRGFPTQARNRGMVALSPSTTREQIAERDENKRRLGRLAHKSPSLALWRLFAFRCSDCKLDTVWDTDTNAWWLLDHTDYGDDGSVA